MMNKVLHTAGIAAVVVYVIGDLLSSLLYCHLLLARHDCRRGWVGGLLIAVGISGLPTHTIWAMSFAQDELATRRVDKGTHQPLLPPPPPPPPEKPPPPKELPPPNPVPTAPDEEGTGVAAEVRLLVKNAVLNAAI